MAEPINIIPQGDPEWWEEWTRRINSSGKPVVGTIRFAFVRVLDVDERQQDTELHIRVECTINTHESFGGEMPRRQSLGGGAKSNYLLPEKKGASKYLEEFNPKLLFSNLKRSQFPVSKWIRRNKDDKTITFSMEVNGWFGMKVPFFKYPIDTQELLVQVTSDWSDGFFVLQTSRESRYTHQFNTKEQFEILREYTLCEGVYTKIIKNSSSKGFNYAQANGAILIRRRALGMFFMLAFRPWAVTTLGFCIFALRPSSDPLQNSQLLSDRITIVLVLLLASAVEPRKSYTTFTYLDIYTSGAFVVLLLLCLESVLVLSELFLYDDQKRLSDTIGFGVLAAMWLAWNIGMCVISIRWWTKAKKTLRDWKAQVEELGENDNNMCKVD